MTLLVLVARLALVAVFLVSGAAKLRDRRGTATAAAAFGVPAGLAPAVAVGLPVVELGSAGLLVLPGAATVTGAVVVLLMLVAFTGAIAASLRRGAPVECHCFGQVSTAPAGWSSVARNVGLAALAVVVLLGGPRLGWVGATVAGYTADQVVLGALVAVLAAAVAVLATALRALTTRYGAVLLRLDAVERDLADDGSPRPAPAFELPGLDGAPVSRRDGTPTLLAFISPGCVHCDDLLPDLARWRGADAPFEVLVLSEGSVEDNRAKVAAFPDLRVALQREREVGDALGVLGTPAAVMVGADGLVAGPVVNGAADIRRNVEAVLSGVGAGGDGHGLDDGLLQIGPRPVREGDPVPVADLRGEVDGLAPVGEEDDVVLVFWEDTCGFCHQIASDLGRLASRSLVLVSASEPAAVRAAVPGAVVVSDPTGAVGSAVGLQGTPSAAHVRDGRLAAAVAVGGPDVLALVARTVSASAGA